MRLKSKVIIITGASRGIGYSIANAMLNEGGKVVICASNQKNADKAVNSLRKNHTNSEILGIGVDNHSTKEIQKAVELVRSIFGTVDVLVNNAGITAETPFLKMTEEEFLNMMEVNLMGVFRWCKAIVPLMQDNGGSIINTSSMVGTYGTKSGCHYATSKFAVNGLSKSLAKELGAYKIRVNCVSPGVTKTDMVSAIPDKLIDALAGMTPLSRVSNPDELTGAYVYLASDESSFVTGSNIAVDGGLVM